MKEGGAEFIKLGGTNEIDMVKRLTDCGFSLCALAYPQAIQYGGYRVQGREMEAAKKCKKILYPRGSGAVCAFGMCSVRLEKHSIESKVPVIGISADQDVDGNFGVMTR